MIESDNDSLIIYGWQGSLVQFLQMEINFLKNYSTFTSSKWPYIYNSYFEVVTLK